MSFYKEAYDAECAAIARALETAARRHALGRVAIYTGVQAAALPMTSGERGPDEMHALKDRKHIATLRQKPAMTIELQ